MFGGPVLFVELLLGSRRTRMHIFRGIYAGWLVLQFGFLFFIYRAFEWTYGAATASFASEYVVLYVMQQLVLLALVTPALTAGGVTDEKERGTLQYLLAAEITASEIIVGKLIGRLAGVASIFIIGLPFLLFVGSFTGMGALGILLVLGQTLLALIGLGGASVLASVWARQTRDAVLGLYAFVAVCFGVQQLVIYIAGTFPPRPAGFVQLAMQSLAELLRPFSPGYLLEPALAGDSAGELLRRFSRQAIAWLSVGGVGTMLAILRMRPAYIRQLEGAGKRKRQLIWTARPPVDAEPIRWKERFVVGLAPLPWFRYIPRWLGLILVVLATLLVGLSIAGADVGLGPIEFLIARFSGELDYSMMGTPLAAKFFLWQGIGVILLAATIVGIRCSGAITGERERHTWEALLLTPLTTTQLVRAKLWGVIGSTYPYLLAYAITTLFCRMLIDPWQVLMLTIELGVCWMAMFYVGATGLWCSARSRSSWRSMLGTMGWAYLGGALMQAILSPILFMMWAIMGVVFTLIQRAYGLSLPTLNFSVFFLAAAAFLAIGFLLGSWYFLKEAEKRVADFDRTRHWHDEPIRPRRRTPTAVLVER
jgi:ABC-type transport system involved in multi-copper enzyme maturation permease subunit